MTTKSPARRELDGLTPLMVAAVDRMRRTQSTAIVRVGSQWWAAENDLPDGRNAAYVATDRGVDFAFPTFSTSTVAALVRRRVLRYSGSKRKAWWPPGQIVPFRATFRT